MKISDAKTQRNSKLSILIFVLLAAGILTAGYFYYAYYEHKYRTVVERQLSAIAELKVGELVQWRKERIADAELFYNNDVFSILIKRYFKDRNDRDAKTRIMAWMGEAQKANRYNLAMLVGANFNTRLVVPKNREGEHLILDEQSTEIVRSGNIAFQDFYRNNQDQHVYLKVLVPIKDIDSPKTLLGILALRIDPEEYLYPLIQQWPIPSRTSETLIVRKEGSDAVFLNELKFQTNTALNLRIPLTHTNTPAVEAVLGKEGILEGVDYRGVPVIADIRSVPNSPWFLVARIDVSEASAPIRERLSMMIYLIIALLVCSGLSVGLVWRREHDLFYRQQHEAMHALSISDARYRRLFEAARDGILILDAETGMVVDVNPFLVEMLGYSREQFFGKRIWELGFFRDVVASKLNFTELQQKEFIQYENLPLETGKGKLINVEFVSYVYSVDDKKVIQCNIRNITERRRAEETSVRLAAIVESSDDAIISKDLNGIITSWNAGAEKLFGYSAHELIGRSITQIVPQDRLNEEEQILGKIRRNESVQHYDTARLAKNGQLIDVSVTVSPIKDVAGNVVGASKVARNITERKRAEDTLHESEEKFRLLYTSMDQGAALHEIITDADGKPVDGVYVDINESYTRLLGITREAIGKRIREVVPLIEQYWIDVFGKVALTGEPAYYENYFETTGRYYSTHAYSPKKKQFAVLVTDITERRRAEESLAHLAAIVESSDDAIIGKDLNGIVTSWNAGAEKLFGYSAQESVGRSIRQIVPQDRLNEEEKILDIIKENKNVQHYDTVRLAKNGQLVDVSLTVSPIKDVAGKVVGASKVARDITERKRAEESLKDREEQFYSLFENMFNVAAIVLEVLLDSEGKPVDHKLLMVNAEFERMTGLNRSAEIGRTSADLSFKWPQDITKSYYQVALGGKPLRWERFNESLQRHYDVSVFSPRKLQFAVLFNDITKRKQAEEEILKLNAELEHRVVQRTSQLEAANKELEAFSYSVSHDLRAPLRHVSGYVELLAKHFQSELSEKGLHYLDSIADSTHQMGKLIDDLLRFSRSGRTEMHRSQLEMNGIVHEAIESVRKDNPGRAIEWVVGKLPSVSGDDAMLRLVWINLLSNAAKFTRTRAKAVIEIGAKAGTKEVIYFVKDNGVGFDMKYAQKLFGVFQRLHSTEEFEGTGVGLANVHRIIMRHGGRTWADAELNKGATFYFSIPHN